MNLTFFDRFILAYSSSYSFNDGQSLTSRSARLRESAKGEFAKKPSFPSVLNPFSLRCWCFPCPSVLYNSLRRTQDNREACESRQFATLLQKKILSLLLHLSLHNSRQTRYSSAGTLKYIIELLPCLSKHKSTRFLSFSSS